MYLCLEFDKLETSAVKFDNLLGLSWLGLFISSRSGLDRCRRLSLKLTLC
jgi:hypothetical protein